MSTEEPAWRAELRGTLEAITEMAFEKGPGLTEAGLDLAVPHIQAAEQRGREAGLREAAQAAMQAVKAREETTSAIGPDYNAINALVRLARYLDPDLEAS